MLRPGVFNLATAIAAVVLFAMSAEAQFSRTQGPVFASQTVDGVPLQPFTFDRQPQRAQAIQVAYYTPPRAVRPAEPVYRDDSDSEARTPGFDFTDSHPMVHGNRAVLRNGIAYAPSNAPDSVKHAIWAVNTICRRPYVWGGGHGSFHDHGYDCSGTISFALHYAGMLGQPLPSSDFLRYGERGRGNAQGPGEERLRLSWGRLTNISGVIEAVGWVCAGETGKE